MDIMRKLWKFERRGVPLTFAVCLALALAVIASYVGLHMVIGAYMAGLFISRLRERPDALLMSRVRLNEMLEDITISLQAILTPLFFVYVGLSFAPQWGKLNLVMLLALIAAAFAGKIIGCGIGAAAVGYRGRSRLEIGTAMCSRGSLELAVLLFGFKAVEGFTMELFAMMVTVTLVTIIATPILYKQAARVG
jgi:Kef-type K+ transport system membrane component KefB